MPTPEQLYAELYQCRLLLQGMAARLAQLESLIIGNAGAGSGLDGAFPGNISVGKNSDRVSPRNTVGGIPWHDTFPGKIGGGNVDDNAFPRKAEAGNTQQTPSPHSGETGNPLNDEVLRKRLIAVLKAQGFPFRTTGARIARGATLMLAIRADATKHGLEHYAKLLRMSASGAGKFMMDMRRLGLIRHKAYSVHELTPRGEELVQKALQPAAEAL